MSTYKKTARDRAKAEIFSILKKDMRISTQRMDRILAKYGIRRNPEQLQRAYRLSVGQQIMAGARDEEGKREILAVRTGDSVEYIVIDACNDIEKLDVIRHRLHSQIMGLEQTAEKVERRGEFFKNLFPIAGKR